MGVDLSKRRLEEGILRRKRINRANERVKERGEKTTPKKKKVPASGKERVFILIFLY